MSTATVGHCVVCGRVLTDPVSIDRSMGPVCSRKGKVQLNIIEHVDPFDPATRDITFRRNDLKVAVFNIPTVHFHHSPTGMEFGYGGSGPADCALNILALFLPVEPGAVSGDDYVDPGFQGPFKTKCWGGTYVSGEAYDLHQEFKRDFIERLPEEGGVIKGEAIEQWIADKLEARQVR